MSVVIRSIFNSPLPMAAHEKLTRAYVQRLHNLLEQEHFLSAVTDYLDRLDQDTETCSKAEDDDHLTQAIIHIQNATNCLHAEMKRVRTVGAIT